MVGAMLGDGWDNVGLWLVQCWLMVGAMLKTSMQSTNKPRPPVPSSMDVCDLGGGSGPPTLHTGGAKNLWVKKNHHTRGERLKIATYITKR